MALSAGMGRSKASVVQPLDQGNLSARAYASLREGLIAGVFRPGERLVIQDLADRFGTSVTPVREACLRLMSERGLEARSGRFFTVPELTLERYVELRTIRLALEGLAAELAGRNAQPADVKRLTAMQRRFETARRDGRADAALMLNREFHFGVYRLSRMEMLVGQIESLWIGMGPILKVYHEDITTEYLEADEHSRLIDALQRHDGAAARQALERDLIRGGQGILDFLASRLPQNRSATKRRAGSGIRAA